jgi:hypothetical protein
LTENYCGQDFKNSEWKCYLKLSDTLIKEADSFISFGNKVNSGRKID